MPRSPMWDSCWPGPLDPSEVRVRVTAAGVESTAWMFTPDNQPDYIVDGLLLAAERMRDNADIE